MTVIIQENDIKTTENLVGWNVFDGIFSVFNNNKNKNNNNNYIHFNSRLPQWVQGFFNESFLRFLTCLMTYTDLHWGFSMLTVSTVSFSSQ